MIDVIPARPWMAQRLKLQEAQAVFGQAMTPASLLAAIEGGMALAAVDGEHIVGMAGIAERWEGCGVAWALLAETFPRYRFSGFKLMKRALDVTPFVRVEAYVVEGHEEAARLLTHLGFAEEGTMPKFWQERNYRLFGKTR